MTKRTTNIIVLLAAIALAFLAFKFFTATEETETVSELPPVVDVITAGEFTGATTISLIGTVRAFSEAAVTAERAGRVTSVPVQLGQTVAAGQIIATLENASERASVLQAEGSYEAALAAAAQGDVGTTEAATRLQAAENSLVNTIEGAYSTVNGAILANVDQFFDDPDSSSPTLVISGSGNAGFLIAQRISYRTTLPEWRSAVDALNSTSDYAAAVALAKTNVNKTIALTDRFLATFADQSGSIKYTQAELNGFAATFNGLRATLVQTNGALNAALTNVATAREGVERANLAASGSQNSAADAQVKQALGSLRAAQANLAKTIIRSPIAGTINTMNVRTGDFVGGQQQIAEVANNDALEIVTSVGEKERNALGVGDTVTIEGNLAGTVTEVAPAIDPMTGKIQVRIASESSDLQNGDTVTVSKEATTTTDSRVFVPLSSVKFKQNDGAVFIVSEGMLESRPVVVGVIRGGSVEIVEGLTSNEAFVRDARGLQAGTSVEVSS